MRSVFLFAIGLPLITALPAAAGDFFVVGGGLNLAQFNRDYPSGFSSPDQAVRFGGAFMAGYQNATTDDHATVLSLGYESRGAVWTGTNMITGESVDATIKFNYLQLGFQYKLLFGSSGAARGYLAPGIGASILLNSVGEAEGETENLEDVNPVDIEPSIALGAQAPIGTSHGFFMEAGYGYGLLDTDSETEEFSAHNSVIKFRIGFLFGI